MAETVDVLCPCCGNRMKVDASTGDVLSEDRPAPKPAKSFEDAMSDVHAGTQRREEAFSKAADKQRRLQDLLDKKFEEARKKAQDDKAPPKNIFDLD